MRYKISCSCVSHLGTWYVDTYVHMPTTAQSIQLACTYRLAKTAKYASVHCSESAINQLEMDFMKELHCMRQDDCTGHKLIS